MKINCHSRNCSSNKILALFILFKKKATEICLIIIFQEDFEKKKYFYELNLTQARVMFSLDTKMLRTVKSHFPSDRKNKDDLWECQNCSRIDSIRHLMRCPYFEEIRVGKNLHSNEEDIVEYFQKVVNIRLENEQAQHL